MPKKYRLTGEEMRTLTGQARPMGSKRMHGTFFSLLVAPMHSAHAKCAIVVSAKTASRAVDRNKIKRRARSVLAKRMPIVDRPLALVFYAKRGAQEAPFSAIERDIEVLFTNLQSR